MKKEKGKDLHKSPKFSPAKFNKKVENLFLISIELGKGRAYG